VLERSRIEEIDRVQRSDSKSHLVKGVVYAEAGLLNEAELEFNALLRENPQSSAVQKLLQSVRAAKR
jgi:hypothetical protein